MSATAPHVAETSGATQVSRSTSNHRILVVLDVDSTLIEQEVIELLAAEAGCEQQVADITYRAMAGELDFAASLTERVALLKGLPSAALEHAREQVQLTAGAREMIEALHAAGDLVAVVSGGFHEVLDPIAEEVGLDHWRANRLEIVDGVLTGRVNGPIIDAAAKAAALTEWAETAGIPLDQTIAVGDGANDLRMMEVAGLSVAFDAKAPVREAADIALDVRDLRQILPLVGLEA